MLDKNLFQTKPPEGALFPSTANVCSQTELGLKPFKQVLYEHQLQFYSRILQSDNTRWVKQALNDHMACSWNSPYLSYICKLRVELGLFVFPLSGNKLLELTNDHFVKLINDQLENLKLPCIDHIKNIGRQRYVRESDASSMITKCKFDHYLRST